jgi:hypothetical protein
LFGVDLISVSTLMADIVNDIVCCKIFVYLLKSFDCFLFIFWSVCLIKLLKLCLLGGKMSSRSSCTIYVGNLPGDTRMREVEDLFRKVLFYI